MIYKSSIKSRYKQKSHLLSILVTKTGRTLISILFFFLKKKIPILAPKPYIPPGGYNDQKNGQKEAVLVLLSRGLASFLFFTRCTD